MVRLLSSRQRPYNLTKLHNNLQLDYVLCRLSMSLCSLFLLLAAAIYAAGGVLAKRGPDYRETLQGGDDADTVSEPSEDCGHLPLLNEEQSGQI